MATWKERNFLCKDKYVSWPGFSPRPYHKLAVERPPFTDTKIKVHQKLRSPAEEGALSHVWGYHTWLDVGRLPPIFRPRPDRPFDSNTWRWITAPRNGLMAQPPVPPPSQLDGNTYVKFIEADGLFVDRRHKERVLIQAKNEIKKCEQLKVRTDCRVPPLDSQGNIIPPKVLKRYKHLLPGKSPASLCVQLRPVTLPSRDSWDFPCPGLEPHYEEAAVRFALKNSSPIYQELLEKYQKLAQSGSKVRPCTPVN